MVDYLGLIAKPKAERNDLAMGHISRSLKTMAMRSKTPVLALSQLSRKVDDRPVTARRPTMSDLSESGKVEQDADSIVLLYRDGVYNPDGPAARYAEIIVGKTDSPRRDGLPEFKNGHFVACDRSGAGSNSHPEGGAATQTERTTLRDKAILTGA